MSAIAATTAAVVIILSLSVVAAAAAAAVAAAAAESVFTKLAQVATLTVLGWVGPPVVSMGLGGMLPVHTQPCVTGFGLDTSGWTELKAGWLDDECSRLGSIPSVSPRPCLVG